jgi:hypothetical protein
MKYGLVAGEVGEIWAMAVVARDYNLGKYLDTTMSDQCADKYYISDFTLPLNMCLTSGISTYISNCSVETDVMDNPKTRQIAVVHSRGYRVHPFSILRSRLARRAALPVFRPCKLHVLSYRLN